MSLRKDRATLKRRDGKTLSNGRDELFEMLIGRVKSAADSPEKLQAAKAALQAAVTLYEHDTAVQKQVEAAKLLLQSPPVEAE